MLKLLKKLEDRFSKIYKTETIRGDNCFVLPNGTIAHLILFTEWKCFVVEYADDVEAYKKLWAEDGDQFYIEGKTEDELFGEIKAEMEGMANG